MSNNGKSEGSGRIDPLRDLDEVIRLIQFLGSSRPGGIGATLRWVEERLQPVRETVAGVAHEQGKTEGEIAPRGAMNVLSLCLQAWMPSVGGRHPAVSAHDSMKR